MFDSLSNVVGGTAAIVIIVLLVFSAIAWIFLPFILFSINNNLKDIYNLIVDIDEEKSSKRKR
jgi:hypothetical protein